MISFTEKELETLHYELKCLVRSCNKTHRETKDLFYLGRASGFETVIKMLERTITCKPEV
jgi:hypothetical protein